MEKILNLLFISLFSVTSCLCCVKVNPKDTLKINQNSLLSKAMSTGKFNFIVYGKKDINSTPTNLTLVEIIVEKQSFQNISVFKVVQKWSENDTVVHFSESILKQTNLESLYHKSWWKKNNQNIEIDFYQKKFNVTGDDYNFNKKSEESIETSLSDLSFINWNCDLILFGLLPFKKGLVFQINLLNPGFSKQRYEYYEVIGSEKVEEIDCWILNYELPNNMGYQRFWISKSENIVIKEEDSFKGSLRYKLKTKVAE